MVSHGEIGTFRLLTASGGINVVPPIMPRALEIHIEFIGRNSKHTVFNVSVPA
jgi:hypothetical protein